LGREPFGLGRDGVDIERKGEGDDIGWEAVDDGAGLFAGAAVGLSDFEGFARFGAPVGDKEGVVGGVKLAGGIVGDVEEGAAPGFGSGLGGVSGGLGRAGGEAKEGSQHEEEEERWVGAGEKTGERAWERAGAGQHGGGEGAERCVAVRCGAAGRKESGGGG
jgi:hypothetical protein